MTKSKRKSITSEIDEIELGYKKPDGGYGWVVLIVAFLISFCLDGCMYSFGIVLDEIKNHYGVTQDVANLVQSLNVGFLFMGGPVSAAFASQFGVRPVVMVASVIFALMYVVSVYMPSIYFLIFFFGVIGGIAFGCAYLTIFIILVDYFEAKLGIANGMTMAGSGLGAFAFAPFTKFLTSKFDWQDTMIILGSITMQCCVLGALFRPVSQFVRKPTKPTIELHDLKADSSHAEPLTDNADKEAKTKPTCSEIVINVLKEISNIQLLKENKSFLFISLANFFVFFVYFIPFIFIPIRAKELKLEQYAWIISTIGIFNIPFRIIFGFMCDRKITSAVNMNTGCTLLASVTLFSYYLLNTFVQQIVFAVFFAIAIAGMNCLATPYLVEIVGSKHFGNANGIINMFRGVGCIFGPFIAGFIYEKTQSMFYPFLFAGISYTISLICSFLAGIFHSRDMKRLEKEIEITS